MQEQVYVNILFKILSWSAKATEPHIIIYVLYSVNEINMHSPSPTMTPSAKYCRIHDSIYDLRSGGWLHNYILYKICIADAWWTESHQMPSLSNAIKMLWSWCYSWCECVASASRLRMRSNRKKKKTPIFFKMINIWIFDDSLFTFCVGRIDCRHGSQSVKNGWARRFIGIGDLRIVNVYLEIRRGAYKMIEDCPTSLDPTQFNLFNETCL